MSKQVIDLTTSVKRHVIDITSDHEDGNDFRKRQRTTTSKWNINWLQEFNPSPHLVGLYINTVEDYDYLTQSEFEQKIRIINALSQLRRQYSSMAIDDVWFKVRELFARCASGSPTYYTDGSIILQPMCSVSDLLTQRYLRFDFGAQAEYIISMTTFEASKILLPEICEIVCYYLFARNTQILRIL
jgi:hypothetical protein